MLTSIIIFLIVFFVIFFLMMKLLPQFTGGDSHHHKNALRQIMEDAHSGQNAEDSETIFKSELEDSALLRLLTDLPGGKSFAALIVKAGYGKNAGAILLISFSLLVIFIVIANSVEQSSFKIFAYMTGILLAYLVPVKFLESRIKKRNNQFINMFPDVLDMIVRSVRSGFPLNTAIQMVAENMEPPVSTEFQQVADEIAMGRTMDEALKRLAERVNEPDINFFVVVLNVQQETGGNLAEVINNLSGIIRKRKQLRLKIQAMTAEGRVTGWILGALPVVVFFGILFTSPDHLEPLFTSVQGNMLLLTAGGMILLAHWIIRQMMDIDI